MDPAQALSEPGFEDDVEPQPVDVERLGPVLVGDRNRDDRQLEGSHSATPLVRENRSPIAAATAPAASSWK